MKASIVEIIIVIAIIAIVISVIAGTVIAAKEAVACGYNGGIYVDTMGGYKCIKAEIIPINGAQK